MNDTTARIYTKQELANAIMNTLDILHLTLAPDTCWDGPHIRDINALADGVYEQGMETDISLLEEDA